MSEELLDPSVVTVACPSDATHAPVRVYPPFAHSPENWGLYARCGCRSNDSTYYHAVIAQALTLFRDLAAEKKENSGPGSALRLSGNDQQDVSTSRVA